MDQKYMAKNMIVPYSTSQSLSAFTEHNVNSQMAALEATIAYCQTARQRYGEQAKALKALCDELGLRKTEVN